MALRGNGPPTSWDDVPALVPFDTLAAVLASILAIIGMQIRSRRCNLFGRLGGGGRRRRAGGPGVLGQLASELARAVDAK